MAEKQVKKADKGGLFIPAGLFLGFAYAFTTGNFLGGMFGGLGIGFLLFALVSVFKKC
jgi:hypothetical protein